MPWSVREDLCLLVAAAGFEPATKGFASPLGRKSIRSTGGVRDFPFFCD